MQKKVFYLLDKIIENLSEVKKLGMNYSAILTITQNPQKDNSYRELV